MATLFDSRQTVNRAALNAIGSTANESLDSILAKINTFTPSATNTYDLGTSSSLWRDIYFSRQLIHAGVQPASVATTPATAATSPLSFTSAVGGNTTIATTGVGGIGALINITSGVGGQATAAATASTGGLGGSLIVSGGAGGAATVSGTGANTGGTAGLSELRSGAGGAASGTSGTSRGGNGGQAGTRPGSGGAATGTGINIGGNGGQQNFFPGAGGVATGGTSATGGNASALIIGGNGQTGGAASGATGANIGGNGSIININNTSTAGAGGAATGGTSALGGTGSAITIFSGNGGNASGASGTNTGGNAGLIVFTAGTGGTGATANGADGLFIWNTQSGTNERMRLDALGNLGIGTTTATNPLEITRTQAGITKVLITNSSSNAAAFAQYELSNDIGSSGSYGVGSSAALANIFANRIYAFASSNTDGLSLVAAKSTGDIRFFTGGQVAANERFRIDSVGKMGTGASLDTQSILSIDNAQSQTILTTTSQYGVSSFIRGTSAGTATVAGFSTAPASAVAVYTLNSMDGFFVRSFAKGAGSTITYANAFRAQGAPTVGTNNAILADNIAYTGSYALNIASTNASTLAGALNVGGAFTVPGASTFGSTTTNSGTNPVTIRGNSTTGVSQGLLIRAGTNTADFPLTVVNSANTFNLLVVRGDGNVFTKNNTLDDSTGAMSVTGLLSATKGLTLGITIGDVSTNSGSMFRMQGTSAGLNWLIANNINVSGLEFTPSTATGGTTYSTPLMVLNATGVGIGAAAAGGFKLDVTGPVRVNNGTNPYIAFFNGTSTGYIQIASGDLNLTSPGSGNISFSGPSGIGAVLNANGFAVGANTGASAILQADSTSRGFLEPRMTQSQRDAISSPATGLQVYNTDTNALNYYNGTTWTNVGSGSGSGGINYLSANSDAEAGVTGYATYADAAGAIPVDGTGGSPTITFSRSTLTPLRGSGNFLITKTAVNSQGQGVSYQFTLDRADQAKVIQVSFDYEIASGFSTFAAGDISVYAYDVTNGTVIQLAPYQLQPVVTGLTGKFIGQFQTSLTGTSYRIIWHIASTNANAWSVRADNIYVGPQTVQYGAAVSDWTTYTPTGGWTTNTAYAGKWRRVGDSMEVDVVVTLSGAPGGSSAFTVNLPTGYTIDTTKTSVVNSGVVFGVSVAKDAGVKNYEGIVAYNGTNNVFVVADEAGGDGSLTATTPFTFGASDQVGIRFTVPIVGWSSNLQMSNDTDTRVVAARYTYGGTQTVPSANTNTLIYQTKVFDTHSAYNTANGVYTAPVQGYYEVTAAAVSQANANNQTVNLHIYKNGVDYAAISRQEKPSLDVSTPYAPNGTSTVFLNAGDTMDIRLENNTSIGLNVLANTLYNWVEIKRLTGPSAIAASESVVARYTTTSGQSLTSGSAQTLLHNTKDFDSHGAYNTATGQFTAPMAGVYRVSCNLLTSINFGNANDFTIYIYKNTSTQHSSLMSFITQNTQNSKIGFTGSGLIRLQAGETCSVAWAGPTSCTVDTTANRNWVTYERVGNYV